jgi:hypothetical protein
MWASPTTLVACAPASVPEGEFMGGLQGEASSGGATYPAPLHPADGADGTRWTFYREWFVHARQLEEGALRATAFYNLAASVQTALTTAPSDVVVSYDDQAAGLSLRLDQSVAHAGVLSHSFMGLMRGCLPEQSLAVAIRDGERRLRRLAGLRTQLVRAISVEEIRFIDQAPVYLTVDAIVVDPLARGFLAGGDLPADWPDRLARALQPGFSTPCTCRADRRVRASLRRRSDLDSDALDPDVMWTPVGDRFCAVYELVCLHTAHRPARAEWTAAGYTPRRCMDRWERATAGEVWLAAETGRGPSRTVVVQGPEAGALAVSTRLVDALAKALGLGVGTTLTLYVPRSNVLLVTDDQRADEGRLSTTLEGWTGTALAEEGLPLGTEIGYLRRVVSSEATGPTLTVQPLELRSS